MDTAPLTEADEALLSHVRELNEETFDPEFFDGAYIVTATVRTTDGELFDGVSLPASIGRASVCAEPVAIGSAVAAGYSHDDLEACVAVAYPMPDHDAEETRVVPPCGVCRELLVDYNPELRVLVPGEEAVTDEKSGEVDGDEVVEGNEASEPVTVAAEELLQVRPW